MIQIGVGRPVERHHRGLISCIVEEVQVVLGVGQVHNVLAVQAVLSNARGARRRLLQPHAVFIVIEINRVAVLNHVLQLAALAPSVRPSAVLQRITNRVVGDALAIECGQLILPVGVAVSVGVRMHRSAQRAGGISIRLLAQNVAAQIVSIHPSGAAAACRGVMRVVGADQLSQLVINIGDLLHAIADAGDVARIVIGVGQRGTGLGNGLHQRRGAARAVAASQIAVSRGNASAARIDSTTGDTAQTVIDISGEKGGASEEVPPKQEK